MQKSLRQQLVMLTGRMRAYPRKQGRAEPMSPSHSVTFLELRELSSRFPRLPWIVITWLVLQQLAEWMAEIFFRMLMSVVDTILLPIPSSFFCPPYCCLVCMLLRRLNCIVLTCACFGRLKLIDIIIVGICFAVQKKSFTEYMEYVQHMQYITMASCIKQFI